MVKNKQKARLEFVFTELKKDLWAPVEMPVRTPEEAVKAIRKMIGKMDREMLISLHLSVSGHVINAGICSIGTMDQTLASPAEILRTALLSGARSLIIIHNHPSGQLKPSWLDLHFTKRMATAADIIGISLADAIIVTDQGTYSFLEEKNEWLQPGERTIDEGAAEGRHR